MHRIGTVLAFAVTVELVLGALAPARAASTITMLDTSAEVGGLEVAIGADGLGLIAYHDNATGDLKVAHCSNLPCTAATITTIDAGDVGGIGDMIVGADGRALIAYYGGVRSVKTAHCDDVACTSATIRVVEQEVVDSQMGMALGADGLPLLAYVDAFRVHVAHCNVPDCTSVTVSDVGPAPGTTGSSVGIGADGLGLIGVPRLTDGLVDVRRCLNVACTATTPAPPAAPGPTVFVIPEDIAVPADGLPLIGYHVGGPAPTDVFARFSRCSSPTCAFQSGIFSAISSANAEVALQPDGRPWLAYDNNLGQLALHACGNAPCTTATVTCVNAHPVFSIGLARGSDGLSLAGFRRFLGGLGVAHDISDACALPIADVEDAAVDEGPGAQATFDIRLDAPNANPVLVSYATSDGTASAGEDYLPVAGTVTFPPGARIARVAVPILADGIDEPNETFVFELEGPTGASLGDAVASGIIIDTDPMPRIVAGQCLSFEGDAGTASCAMPLSLVTGSTQPITVAYGTADDTATAGADYTASSGIVTFPPGSFERSVVLTVLGDTVVERDEGFVVNLSNPTNATLQDGVGEATIRDDDAPSLSSLELTHGARLTADLAAAPGPAADQDAYRLAQPPYTSWEVVVDEASGDVAPGLRVLRLAEDNSGILQSSVNVGTGSAQTLRWQHRSALPESRQHILVGSASCGTGCGADDTYRLRAYETTVRIARFNNVGSQITVLILQNATDRPLAATADFWSAGGVLQASLPVPLGPHAVSVVNTSTVVGLAGVSGSISATHDGPYGALSGKAVSLEPATGFSFDSPMAGRPR
jgi:hypothetical protein